MPSDNTNDGTFGLPLEYHPMSNNAELRAAIERAHEASRHAETWEEANVAFVNALAAENAVCKLMAKAALPSGPEWNRVEGQSAALLALAKECMG